MPAKPSDFTGKQREEVAKRSAEELAERQGQISTALQIELDRNQTDVFDPSSGDSLGTASVIEVDLKEEEVVIRVVEDIEDMTYGAGTRYSFKAGQKYKVKKSLAAYLDSIGYVHGGL